MNLFNLDMYKIALEIGNNAWQIVDRFPYFAKDTLGKQLVKAADSIAANISEGEGSFYSGDKIGYLYYAMASLFETITWISNASKRKLMEEESHKHLEDLLYRCLKMINSNLKYQKSRISK